MRALERICRRMGLIDPQGENLWQAIVHMHQQYTCKGPNMLWTMDSYHKLKPYGIIINDCIDGFGQDLALFAIGFFLVKLQLFPHNLQGFFLVKCWVFFLKMLRLYSQEIMALSLNF